MEQKTVEQIAVELYPNRVDAALFLNGYSYAQQSQPMWREIEGDKMYNGIIVKDWNDLGGIYPNINGHILKSLGYTHYLSSDDLLKLPTEKK